MSKCKTFCAVIALTWFVIGCSSEQESALEGAGKSLKNAADETAQAAGDAVDSTAGAAGDAVDSVTGAAGDAVDSVAGTARDMAAGATDNLQETFADITKKASAALENIDGGSELLGQVNKLFDSAGTTLQGITDLESAKAALPKITAMTGTVEDLSSKLGTMPAEAKTVIAGVIEKGMGPLKALVDKILAFPGVKDTIQPQLDEFMSKLSALAGKNE